MLHLLAIVLPVFGLIGVGFLAGKLRILREETGPGVSDFAFTIGLPAVLFRTVANAELSAVSPFGVLAAFFGAAWSVWLLSAIATHYVLRRPAMDAPPIAMSAVFGNTIMLGIPLVLETYGQAGAAPMAMILAVHAALLWMTGTVHMQLVASGEEGSGNRGAGVFLALLADLTRNPIIIAVILGMLWQILGIKLPAPLDKTLALLAQAGVPCSLFALGLSLVRFKITGEMRTLVTITLLKVVVMPAIAWLLAVKLLRLDPVTAGVVVIFAAVPTGANAFLFATKHGRAVNSASGAVALGTMVAAVTVSIVLSVMHP